MSSTLSASPVLWASVITLILAMLAVDLLAHRHAHVVTVREAAAWSGVWVALGVGFGAFLFIRYGADPAGQYFAGYLIEKSLAVDNVFVFALLLSAFAVPRELQHRVLFFGVLGALVLRAAFIAGGTALIDSFHAVLYVFGAFLVFTAIRMARHGNEESDPREGRLWHAVSRILPSTKDFHGNRFIVRVGGRRLLTPLAMVLVLVEISDIVFAVDSIPAIFAVTTNPFLVFTSNAFAILGLRAMYFLLADLMHRFVYLRAGLAAVLGFVGVKMLIADLVHIPVALSLAVIVGCVGVAVWASLRRTAQGQPPYPQCSPPVAGEGVTPPASAVRPG